MNGSRPTFLHLLLLAGFAVRLAFGAPCCWTGGPASADSHDAPETAMMVHSSHQAVSEPADDGHDEHGEDNRAKPCCSACGPVLPTSPVLVSTPPVHLAAFNAQRLRDLAPPPSGAPYLARGPPSLA